MNRRPIELVVLSDVHLGNPKCKANSLAHYLKSILPDTLILNGDFIDNGTEYHPQHWPTAHTQVMREIFELANLGTKIIYVVGTQETWMQQFAQASFKNLHLMDQLEIEVQDKRAWVVHGDVFNRRLRSFKWMSKLGSVGVELLTLMFEVVDQIKYNLGLDDKSSTSVITNKTREFEKSIVDIAASLGFDYIICGNTHLPKIKQFISKNGPIFYLNPGDWLKHMSALEFRQNRWHLFYCEDPLISVSTVSSISPELSYLPSSVN